MARVISTKKGIDFPNPEGMADETINRRWNVRFGETDKDTRGNRTDRKASVTTLTPKLAIVNVYQLFNKRSRKLAERGRKSRVSPTGEKIKGVSPGVYGYGLPAYEEKNGELLNEKGNPVTRDGESKHEYNSRVYKWRVDKGLEGKRTEGKKETPAPQANKGKPQSQRKAQEEEEEEDRKRRREISIREAADEAARLLKENKVRDPRWILTSKAEGLKVHTTSNVGMYEVGPLEAKYSKRDPSDPREYASIMKTLVALKNKKLLPPTKAEKEPPIVAIRKTSLEPIKYYYIKNELIESRRKKTTKVQVKRQGSKRKVVMKKKGGRR